MIDEDYDFGRPRFFPNQLGKVFVLIVIVAIGILWWKDTLSHNSEISKLKSENRKLLDQLESSSAKAESPFLSASFKKKPSPVPDAKNELPAVAPGKPARVIDVDQFIATVKTATQDDELKKLDFKADNIAEVVKPLLLLTREREYCQSALYTLRMIPLKHLNREELVTELINVIDTNRFGDEVECNETNRHAYSFLVSLDQDAIPASGILSEIMTSDHSPWAAYACATLKMIDPKTDVESQMIKLLQSSYKTNRLISARKFPDFVQPAVARRWLRKAYVDEKVQIVRESILNSINRLSSMPE